ncbi:MAG: ABC transporter substrate-binding protein, partial [Acidobacteria bacterium]|nr:ABC transporter substrate-binding protein [Acidobacteriota bacterium]
MIYKGRAGPAAGPVAAANKFWVNRDLKPVRQDPQAALRRLEKAGFKRQGAALVDAGGVPVEFSVVTNTNKTRERMAAMIQQDLARIGIKLNIVALDFPSLL